MNIISYEEASNSFPVENSMFLNGLSEDFAIWILLSIAKLTNLALAGWELRS